jgi:hypothetical protein
MQRWVSLRKEKRETGTAKGHDANSGMSLDVDEIYFCLNSYV